MLKPVKKKSVRGQVLWQLRDQIIRRTWSPGSKLPSEHEHSQTMGVSRVSIRARDAQAAENIMQEHVDRTIERLKAAAGLAAPGATRTGDRPARASSEEKLALHRAF